MKPNQAIRLITVLWLSSAYDSVAACFKDCRVSEIGLAFIQHEEGTSIVAYPDTAGHSTICTGHLIQPNEHFAIPYMGCTALLRKDVGRAESVLNRSIKVSVPQHVYDPLASLCFNAGPVIGNSGIVRTLNAGDQDGACRRFPNWRWAGGKPVLLGRRLREQAICLLGVD